MQNTLVNYWFRHIWEYSWPLYPGIILASKLSGINLYKLSLAQLPLSLAMLLSGIFFYILTLHPLKDFKDGETGENSGRREGDAAKKNAAFSYGCTSHFSDNYTILLLKINFLIAVSAAIIVTLFMVKAKPREIPGLLLKGMQINMVILVIAVMVFNAILKQSGSVQGVAGILRAANVPVVFVLAFLPFLAQGC